MTNVVTSEAAIPLLDLKAQYATIRREIREAIDQVCDDQRFIGGYARSEN